GIFGHLEWVLCRRWAPGICLPLTEELRRGQSGPVITCAVAGIAWAFPMKHLMRWMNADPQR
ncbi:MAG: DUF2842 domain-containing protein, partial [Pseudomonadota bacterium]